MDESVSETERGSLCAVFLRWLISGDGSPKSIHAHLYSNQHICSTLEPFWNGGGLEGGGLKRVSEFSEHVLSNHNSEK